MPPDTRHLFRFHLFHLIAPLPLNCAWRPCAPNNRIELPSRPQRTWCSGAATELDAQQDRSDLMEQTTEYTEYTEKGKEVAKSSGRKIFLSGTARFSGEDQGRDAAPQPEKTQKTQNGKSVTNSNGCMADSTRSSPRLQSLFEEECASRSLRSSVPSHHSRGSGVPAFTRRKQRTIAAREARSPIEDATEPQTRSGHRSPGVDLQGKTKSWVAES